LRGKADWVAESIGEKKKKKKRILPWLRVLVGDRELKKGTAKTEVRVKKNQMEGWGLLGGGCGCWGVGGCWGGGEGWGGFGRFQNGTTP